jgi:hypothetical protein
MFNPGDMLEGLGFALVWVWGCLRSSSGHHTWGAKSLHWPSAIQQLTLIIKVSNSIEVGGVMLCYALCPALCQQDVLPVGWQLCTIAIFD